MKKEKDEHRQRIIAAVGDFLNGRPKRDKAEFAQKEAKFADKQRTLFGKQEYK